MKRAKVAIVDYGICNMFSVQHACTKVGLEAMITASLPEIEAADGIILPGVGAFGDAMDELKKRDLVSPLRDLARSGKPFFGICLGYQLLLSESEEFGNHKGLDIIPGRVVRFESPREGDQILNVPHVGWSQVLRPHSVVWEGTPLEGVPEKEFVYFCHSFHIVPERPEVALSRTRYGHYDFVSSLREGNIFAFQFHPEKSGPIGIKMYQKMAEIIQQSKENL